MVLGSTYRNFLNHSHKNNNNSNFTFLANRQPNKEKISYLALKNKSRTDAN